jgi:CDP-glycerol glycerophosphotransferase
MAARRDAPAVTVVVIAYDDAANLPTAVRSVTTQTLRDVEVIVVDDASTDGTGAVADALAAADPRVRAVHLDVNSGGCSRPRNVGMSHAHGRYLMFLDSDDELDRTACETLVRVAERAGVDLVAGRVIRYHKTRKRSAGWYDRLFREAAVVDGILDRPEVLYDSISTNKLYRREFVEREGLRFPEGLHYEDLLFTTEAYCTARGIAIVPHVVYVWNVVEDVEAGEPLSITRRRLDLANWRDRLTIHRRIDAFLADHHVGRQLRLTKDTKFLNHDFVLFLRDLPRYAGDGRRELFELVRDYVASLDLAACLGATVTTRIGAQLTSVGDLPRVLAVADYAATGQVDSDVVARDGRVYWTGVHLESDTGRTLLDVTDLGWLDAPLAKVPFANVVESVLLAGSTLRVTGSVRDLLGRLAAAWPVPVEAMVVSKGAGWRLAGRVVTAELDGDGLRYTVEYDLDAVGRRITLRDRLFRLVLMVGPRGTRFSMRDVEISDMRVPVGSRYRRLVGGELSCTLVDGTLGLTLSDRHPAVQRGVEALRRVRDSRARARRIRAVARRLGLRSTVARGTSSIARRSRRGR